MIDRNCPWRLVADLASPVMQTYMAKHNTSLEKVFSTHYTTTGGEDVAALQSILLSSYNQLVSTFSLMRELGCVQCSNLQKVTTNVPADKIKVRTTVKNIHRRTETRSSLLAKVPEAAWLELYVHVKNSESGFPHDATKIRNIIRDAKEINSVLDIRAGTSYINNMFQNFTLYNALTEQMLLESELAAQTTGTTQTARSTAQTGGMRQASGGTTSTGGY